MPPSPSAPEIGAASSIGLARDHQEDFYGVPSAALGADPARVAARGLLVAVADGMGGHAAGEVASHIAIETLFHAYYESEPFDGPAAALERAVHQANGAIYAQASADLSQYEMGCTIVAAVARADGLTIAHVGDSRAYRRRGNRLQALTVDHTWVEAQVQSGTLTRAQARRSVMRNQLLQALGTKPEVAVTVSAREALRPGDILLLCSDGVHGPVSNAEMRRALDAPSALEAARRLVALADGHGGPDNSTAVVVRMPGRAPAPLTPLLLISAMIALLAIVFIFPVAGGLNTLLAIATATPTAALTPARSQTAIATPPATAIMTIGAPTTAAPLALTPSPSPAPTAAPIAPTATTAPLPGPTATATPSPSTVSVAPTETKPAVVSMTPTPSSGTPKVTPPPTEKPAPPSVTPPPTAIVPTVAATAIPPTSVPPTAIPPTPVPPTAVPPTPLPHN
ncbi:MAG: serine/threonine-protein phosphatase [Chloroflexi bacterium]|nr:serine/threonine-protein phosphatase [Chloroflexota bacterium]